MSDLMISLADVMRAEIKTLDTIANNTANANTPGFRAEYASIKNVNFLDQIQNPAEQSSSLRADGTIDNSLNNLSSGINRSIQQNDGSIKTTGTAHHLALRGPAWFVVEKDNQVYLTRNGKFQIDSEGNLKTSSGENVMGESGPIKGLRESFSITADGKVKQAQGETNRLKIVTTPRDAAFKSAGNALYQTASFEAAAPNSFSVIPGAYEVSNTDVATDMIRLMQTTRHIETIQRSISAYDQLLNVGINQLGK